MIMLFNGELKVRYGYFRLFPRGGRRPAGFCRIGQENGLCAASDLRGLCFITGLHAGRIPLCVEWHRDVPPVDDEWEDIVEVSFAMPAHAVAMVSFDEEVMVHLPRTGPLRVRYCATGMDPARDQDTRMPGDPVVDDYLVQLWPEEPGPDAIVKQTSEWAAGRHAGAQPGLRDPMVLPVDEILVAPELRTG